MNIIRKLFAWYNIQALLYSCWWAQHRYRDETDESWEARQPRARRILIENKVRLMEEAFNLYYLGTSYETLELEGEFEDGPENYTPQTYNSLAAKGCPTLPKAGPSETY